MTKPNSTVAVPALPAGTRVVPLACLDQMHQLKNELQTVWLALGNTQDLEDDGLLVPIREAVNGITNRLSATLRAMGE